MANTRSLTEIKSIGDDLRGIYTNRDTMFKEIEQMYLLQTSDLPGDPWIKETIDPDPRNKLNGAIRLLTATMPKWEVPYDSNSPDGKELSSAIESIASNIWNMASRVAQRRLTEEVVKSALLYGEIHTATWTMDDMLKTAGANRARIERAKAMTPLMFQVYNPRTGYPLFDSLGLQAYYREIDIKAGEVIGTYGKDAEALLVGKKASDLVTLYEYWDDVTHAVWLDEGEIVTPQPHNLPSIPISARIAEGSELFLNSDQQTRQPFLYGLWKSNLWHRQNLYLTVVASLAFAIGANPLLVLNQATPEDDVRIDATAPLNRILVPPGASLSTLAKSVIDPSLTQMSSEIARKVEDSTIYGQTLGQPLGGNAPYSMVQLLHQAGRLPLVPFQIAAGEVIADSMRTGLMTLKQAGGDFERVVGGQRVKLKYKDLPDDLDISCKLDVHLPQDMRQNAAVAAQVVGSGLASKRWARENTLDIGQSDEMTYEVLKEQLTDVMVQQQVQQMIQQQQMQMQGQMQQQQGPPPEMQGGQMPQDMGQGMGQPALPPEAMQGPQQASAGLPMTEPMMPPEGAEYGQQRPY